MSHPSQSVTHKEIASCSTNVEQSSTGIMPKTERLDDHDFRAPANPARSYPTRREQLQLPPRKLPRFSTPSTSSEVRCYHSSNIHQENMGPSTSRQTSFRNIEEPVATPEVFEIFLDVHEYKPDELKVKVADEFIIIDGEHGERTDDVSLISQQFTRRYDIPEELDKGKISCFMSSDGILCIFGPMNPKKADREIPIIPVDKPTKMTASTKFKAMEKKLLQSAKNQGLKKQPQALVMTQAVQESVLPQPEVAPVPQEQMHVPEAQKEDNVPELNN